MASMIKKKIADMEACSYSAKDRNAFKSFYMESIRNGNNFTEAMADAEGRFAELTAKKRNSLKDKTFALPDTRQYPIHDLAHARNALARVAQNGTPEQKSKVRAAVARKFPKVVEHAEDGADFGVQPSLQKLRQSKHPVGAIRTHPKLGTVEVLKHHDNGTSNVRPVKTNEEDAEAQAHDVNTSDLNSDNYSEKSRKI